MKGKSPVPPLRKRIQQLRALHRQFGDLVRAERALICCAALALGVEIAMTLLGPWPIKYLFDGLLMPSASSGGLFLVPADYPAEHPTAFVIWLGVAILGIAIVGGTAAYYRQVWSAAAGQQIVNKVRKRLYGHLLGLSLRFHRDRKLGDLLLRITGDIPVLRDVLSEAVIELAGRVVLVLGILVILLWIDAPLAIVSIVTLVLVLLLAGMAGRNIARTARRQREKEGLLAGTATEALSAVTLIKAYGREQEMLDRFARQNRSAMRKGLKGTRLQAALAQRVEICFAIGIAVVIGYGALRVIDAQALSPGDLLVFVSYVRYLQKPLRRLSQTSTRIGKASACGQRILEIFNVQPEERDRDDARPAPRLRGAIDFAGVQFGYQRETAVLRNLTLAVPAGQSLAIVGRNGAGKSTLTNLLLRFFEPDAGAIRLDGVNARELTIASVRAQISVALQDTYLFGTTVRDNLLLSAPDATDEDMMRALDLVGAADFIARLPNGLESEVKEGGRGFSGGECRKLALAGALLRPSAILILDEPTTHVDAATRDDLLRRFPSIVRGRTTLVITHDPELLAHVDRVVLLENGRIVGDGADEQLRVTSASYRRLFPLSTIEPGRST
ncbi:MAG: ABC transporter ATP-binding protein [Planctomycetota bacterium]